GALGKDLERFVQSLETGRFPSLQSIYLDTDLDRNHLLNPDLRQAVNRLVQICNERKVDLVFEPVPRDRAADPLISPEFQRRQKERRRRLEATA
ncbi:hypothetical protein JCM11491_003613, partial [Sporobolomyces phaffii]